MIVWLWDAMALPESGGASPVSKREPLRSRNSSCAAGRPSVVKVEGALLALGVPGRPRDTSGPGRGARGCHGDSGTQWEPFALSPETAAS